MNEDDPGAGASGVSEIIRKRNKQTYNGTKQLSNYPPTPPPVTAMSTPGART